MHLVDAKQSGLLPSKLHLGPLVYGSRAIALHTKPAATADIEIHALHTAHLVLTYAFHAVNVS